MTLEDQKAFIKEYFEPRSAAIMQEICNLREALRADTTITVNIETDVVEKTQ